MAHSTHSIQEEVRRYWKVFAALVVGTIITVGIANVHLGILLPARFLTTLFACSGPRGASFPRCAYPWVG